MGGTIKAAGAGLAALVLWINGTFGEVFYFLTALLVIDAILNYANEGAYLQKLSWYTVSSGAAFYIQNASMSGIQIARGIMVLLAIHEATQVSLKMKELYKKYKDGHPDEGPPVETVSSEIDQIVTLVLNRIQASPTDSVKSVYTEGANGE